MSSYDDVFRSLSDERSAAGTASPYDSVFSSVVRLNPQQEQNARLHQADFSGTTLKIGPLDTGVPLPADAARALTQLGAGMDNWRYAFAPPAAVDEKRRMDAPLVSEGAGKAMNLLGEILPTTALPFGILKAGGRWAPTIEGATVGATIGATQPVGTGESRGFNTTLGAVGGGSIPAALAFLARPSSQLDTIVQAAQREGMPLGPADVTQNKAVRTVRSVLDDIVGGGNQQAKQEAYNAAWARRVGAPEGASLPSSAIRDANKATGKEMEAIWGQNDLNYTNDLFGKLQKIKADADKLESGERRRVLDWVNEFESAAVLSPNGKAVIPGDVAFARQSALRKDVDSATGFLKNSLSDLRSSILDGFNKSVTGEDAKTLSAARSRYKLGKTLEPLADKGAVGTAGRIDGDIPASLVPEALRMSYRSGVPQDLADLSAAGSQFLVNRVPQTGGSLRALLQNGLLGGLSLGGIGAIAGVPGAATALPYAAGSFGAARLLNELLNRPALLNMAQRPSAAQVLLPASLAASLGVAPATLP